MADNKMSPELQIAIRRSPDYTAPSAELVALRAEVAAWRRAVRWVSLGGDWHYSLRVGDTVIGSITYDNGWAAAIWNAKTFGHADRNTACAKVCELLGIPTVLPGGE